MDVYEMEGEVYCDRPLNTFSAVTYCGNQLVDAVWCHAVEVSEMELQVDLVVEHVLAQRAAEHGLH